MVFSTSPGHGSNFTDLEAIVKDSTPDLDNILDKTKKCLEFLPKATSLDDFTLSCESLKNKITKEKTVIDKELKDPTISLFFQVVKGLIYTYKLSYLEKIASILEKLKKKPQENAAALLYHIKELDSHIKKPRLLSFLFMSYHKDSIKKLLEQLVDLKEFDVQSRHELFQLLNKYKDLIGEVDLSSLQSSKTVPKQSLFQKSRALRQDYLAYPEILYALESASEGQLELFTLAKEKGIQDVKIMGELLKVPPEKIELFKTAISHGKLSDDMVPLLIEVPSEKIDFFILALRQGSDFLILKRLLEVPSQKVELFKTAILRGELSFEMVSLLLSVPLEKIDLFTCAIRGDPGNNAVIMKKLLEVPPEKIELFKGAILGRQLFDDTIPVLLQISEEQIPLFQTAISFYQFSTKMAFLLLRVPNEKMHLFICAFRGGLGSDFEVMEKLLGVYEGSVWLFAMLIQKSPHGHYDIVKSALERQSSPGFLDLITRALQKPQFNDFKFLKELVAIPDEKIGLLRAAIQRNLTVEVIDVLLKIPVEKVKLFVEAISCGLGNNLGILQKLQREKISSAKESLFYLFLKKGLGNQPDLLDDLLGISEKKVAVVRLALENGLKTSLRVILDYLPYEDIEERIQLVIDLRLESPEIVSKVLKAPSGIINLIKKLRQMDWLISQNEMEQLLTVKPNIVELINDIVQKNLKSSLFLDLILRVKEDQAKIELMSLFIGRLDRVPSEKKVWNVLRKIATVSRDDLLQLFQVIRSEESITDLIEKLQPVGRQEEKRPIGSLPPFDKAAVVLKDSELLEGTSIPSLPIEHVENLTQEERRELTELAFSLGITNSSIFIDIQSMSKDRAIILKGILNQVRTSLDSVMGNEGKERLIKLVVNKALAEAYPEVSLREILSDIVELASSKMRLVEAIFKMDNSLESIRIRLANLEGNAEMTSILSALNRLESSADPEVMENIMQELFFASNEDISLINEIIEKQFVDINIIYNVIKNKDPDVLELIRFIVRSPLNEDADKLFLTLNCLFQASSENLELALAIIPKLDDEKKNLFIESLQPLLEGDPKRVHSAQKFLSKIERQGKERAALISFAIANGLSYNAVEDAKKIDIILFSLKKLPSTIDKKGVQNITRALLFHQNGVSFEKYAENITYIIKSVVEQGGRSKDTIENLLTASDATVEAVKAIIEKGIVDFVTLNTVIGTENVDILSLIELIVKHPSSNNREVFSNILRDIFQASPGNIQLTLAIIPYFSEKDQKQLIRSISPLILGEPKSVQNAKQFLFREAQKTDTSSVLSTFFQKAQGASEILTDKRNYEKLKKDLAGKAVDLSSDLKKHFMPTKPLLNLDEEREDKTQGDH